MKMKNLIFAICASAAGVANAQRPGVDSVNVHQLVAQVVERVAGNCVPFDPMNRNPTKTPPAPEFMPVKVWAAGKVTFIELVKPYQGELPMVWAQVEDSSVSAVNFNWDEQNSRFVVERILDRVVLVLRERGAACTVGSIY